MKADAYDLTVEKNAVNMKGGVQRRFLCHAEFTADDARGRGKKGRRWIGSEFKTCRFRMSLG